MGKTLIIVAIVTIAAISLGGYGLISSVNFTTANVSYSSGTTLTSTTQTSTVATFSTTSSYTNYTGPCVSLNGLPDPRCTPGATNPSVNQSNINSTICVSGFTSKIRPPESYTEKLKEQQIIRYGYTNTSLSLYEEDHLISLEIGGSPTSPLNLWPEPHYGNYTSYMKDGFENFLNSQVCSFRLTLSQAQFEISSNWIHYWLLAGRPNGSNSEGS